MRAKADEYSSVKSRSLRPPTPDRRVPAKQQNPYIDSSDTGEDVTEFEFQNSASKNLDVKNLEVQETPRSMKSTSKSD
jgi:hypothetical protein